ncbi:glycosyl transferase family protein [Qipengyuania spongiae]|uniref:Glycosyl transferase family protein n=1 Tax=Qipengyuania spongiae TaxID=2909673 RepID=A0ABY5T0R4_9SPHN|nr:glycosyl transferase family protein [Qipengyuania spongiae]UVI40392.1 glycosyl transferase family protein [Qipengyuania spongiae]
MDPVGFTAAEWFVLIQHELFLFTAVFFLIGAFDEIVVDVMYLWLRLTGRISSRAALPEGASDLSAPVAIFIPAWCEAEVIGTTLQYAMRAWPQKNARFYVGCYRNDAETPLAAAIGADGDRRARIVIHDRDGPTSKADCLNRLYAALEEDERQSGARFRMVVLHDAEDMVDPAALALMDRTLDQADFVQLPVLALPQKGSPLIAGHYVDEFAEVHGKTMVVRDALGAGLPGAGVGCAIDRSFLDLLAKRNGGETFSSGSLTEDYELGLEVAALGGRSRFIRARAKDGRLVATRAYFPAHLSDAVRQKTRWVHGIALQSWDRLGWRGGLSDLWMQMRDRRGPFAALLLALGYMLVVLSGVQIALSTFGAARPIVLTPLLEALLLGNLLALFWRLSMRVAFTTSEFGWREGLLAMPRILVSNVIAIMAGRRAIVAYVRTLAGEPVRWEKTEHRDHPVLAESSTASA